MDVLDNEIPFPQANNFGKIIKILDTTEEILKDYNKLKVVINVGTERQVRYYLSASTFLGIVDKNNNFTNEAYQLKEMCYENKVLALSRMIISKPVFGEIFFKKFYYGEEADNDTIAQLISDLYSIDNYSVCLRRAGTVKNWLKWINSNIDL